MKQDITPDELKELIHKKLNTFIGQPNDQRTRQRIFNVISSLIKQYPQHIDIIEQTIKEGPKDGNSSQT